MTNFGPFLVLLLSQKRQKSTISQFSLRDRPQFKVKFRFSTVENGIRSKIPTFYRKNWPNSGNIQKCHFLQLKNLKNFIFKKFPEKFLKNFDRIKFKFRALRIYKEKLKNPVNFFGFWGTEMGIFSIEKCKIYPFRDPKTEKNWQGFLIFLYRFW